MACCSFNLYDFGFKPIYLSTNITKNNFNLAFEQNYTADESDILTKDFKIGDLQPNNDLGIIVEKYKSGKFDEVTKNLKSSSAEKKTSNFKNYYIGLFYLAQKKQRRRFPSL